MMVMLSGGVNSPTEIPYLFQEQKAVVPNQRLSEQHARCALPFPA